MEVTVKCKEVCKYCEPDLKGWGSILESRGHIWITIDNYTAVSPNENTKERMILHTEQRAEQMLISLTDSV